MEKISNSYIFRTIKYVLLQFARKTFSLISKDYRREYLRLKNEIIKFAPKRGDILHISNPNTLYNSDYFKSTQFEVESQFVDKMGQVIYKIFKPTSVVDVGCGRGLFLRYFLKKGIRIKGYEGSSNAFSNMVIPKKMVTKVDLRKILPKETKFKLAFSLEVAEHIEKEFVGVYMENLTSLSNTVVFSSPPPGLTETHPHHPNEQLYSKYWDILFGFYGFREDESKTKRLRRELKQLNLPFRLKEYTTAKVYVKSLEKTSD